MPPQPPPPHSFLPSCQSSCDFLVACNSTGWDLPKRLLGYKLHDGIIGVAGLVSALSAVYKAYPQATPARPPPAAASKLLLSLQAKDKAA